ncbi:fibronectin type III domain-containing protein [Maribacter sp.]
MGAFVVMCVLLLSCSDSEAPQIIERNDPPSSFVVNALNIQQRSVDLNWTRSIDPEESVVFYDVFLGNEKIIDNTRELSYSFENLLEGTEYTGKVVASDPEGNEVSQNFSFTTMDNGSPSAFSMQVHHVNHSYTKVTWTESVDPEGSKISYQIALDDSTLDEGIEEREFILPELMGLTTYSIRITATDEDGKTTTTEQSLTTQTKVFDNDMNFENQLELDEFAAKGYNRIEGDLYIGSTLNLTDITDLSALSTVTYLRGNLTITRTACQSLSGLENINDHWFFTEVKVFDNQELLDIDGLNGFVRPYYIYINNNSKLKNIEGLSNMTGAVKECTISGNDALTDIKGLRNLTDIPKIEISGNDRIIDLSGLESMVLASEGIYIYSNEQLRSVKGLDNFKTGGDINLDRNPNLQSISNLSSLESARSVKITASPLLTSLSGLEKLKEITLALQFFKNSGLTSLEGIANVEFKNNDRDFYYFSVRESPLITNLDPLQNYIIPSGNINITENANLSDFCGITKLATNFNDGIGDSFSIRFNAYDISRQDIVDGNCKQP